MRDVLVRFKVSFKHKADTHSVSASLGHVDWCSDGSSELQLVRFNGHDLDQGHLFYQFLRALVVKAVSVSVPSSTLDIHTLDVGSLFDALSYL